MVSTRILSRTRLVMLKESVSCVGSVGSVDVRIVGVGIGSVDVRSVGVGIGSVDVHSVDG